MANPPSQLCPPAAPGLPATPARPWSPPRQTTQLHLLLAGALLGLAPLPAVVQAQTTIQGVRPTAVSLTPGGGAQELAAQGSALDQVRSIEVTLSGRVVSGVTARLLRQSATEIRLELSAAGDVGSMRGLRPVLVTPRQRVELPVEVEVVALPPQPPAAEEPPPDPVVQAAGVFLVSIQPLGSGAGVPPDPVTRAVGSFVVMITSPTVVSPPPEPVTRSTGTFLVTIAPPGADGA